MELIRRRAKGRGRVTGGSTGEEGGGRDREESKGEMVGALLILLYVIKPW